MTLKQHTSSHQSMTCLARLSPVNSMTGENQPDRPAIDGYWCAASES